jgi:tetratricopeptide (TPR) repeat protein
LKNAYGKFETDYWMLSIQEASEWLKQDIAIGERGKSTTIATNCMYPATVYLNDSIRGIKTKYVRYYDRSEHQWDYALYYSRFVDRWQLQNGIWPPKGTIHTIQADGIPLCAIVKRENTEDYLGFEASKMNDQSCAIEHFTNAMEYDPNNEKVALALSIIYFKSGQLDKAEKALSQSLKIYPDNPAAQIVLNAMLTERQKTR